MKALGNILVRNGLADVIILLFRQKNQNHLPKRWLAHSLKIQEILAKKWALLRASTNGLRAVFAGFLCIFKFTGSAAPRLGGLTRFIERSFFVGYFIFLDCLRFWRRSHRLRRTRRRSHRLRRAFMGQIYC